MIYNSISVKNILARVYRTFQLDSSDWVYDAIEWAGEAMEQIGHIGQYERKPAVLEIENFKANLPCDLVTLDLVWGDNGRIPYGGSKIEFCKDDYQTGVQNNENLPYYQLEMDKIKTSFESGSVYITYEAYPTDDDGFPMVPDMHEYKEAIAWRIISQMLIGGWTPKNPQLNFQYADQKFELFVVRASNRAKFPSPDRMETIRRFFTSLVPDYTQWSDGMTGLEQPDNIDIDGNTTGGGGSISSLKKYSYPNKLDNNFGQNV
jgi:hypothetical protein